jgi:hypothetical protein
VSTSLADIIRCRYKPACYYVTGPHVLIVIKVSYAGFPTIGQGIMVIMRTKPSISLTTKECMRRKQKRSLEMYEDRDGVILKC